MIYFFVVRKMSYNWFNRKESLQKAKGRYHNVGGKEKAAKYYLKNRSFNKKMQIISIEVCQKKKKKKQKENIKEIDTKT